ncbi:MAG: nitroreductase family protein [Halanaerobiales bacterium]|nr:nitroreductase family protein [Halanaerobiales bacterium]
MFKELVVKNRSYRRFKENYFIDKEVLKELLDYARLANSASNRQPLKYMLSNQEKENDKVFASLSWAGYLEDWPGPEPGERPSAYIIMLGDTTITNKFYADPGIACAYIMLGAVEKGLGGCIFAAINHKKLRKQLAVPEQYEILYVLALGKPVEAVKLESVGEEGDIKYWRDQDQVHHVPKRGLVEIILND